MATKKVSRKKVIPKTKKASKAKESRELVVAVPVNPYQDIAKVKASQTFQAFQDSYGGAEDFLDAEGFERLLLKFGYSTTWVYIAVRRIADAVCQIPLYLIEPSADGARHERVNGYDFGLQSLINNPNPWQRWVDFSQMLMTSLELTGNAYIELVTPPGGARPTEMYVLNPSRMVIIPDKKNYIKAFVYTANGKRFYLDPEQVIHIKYPHPMNDFYGFAPLTAARVAVEVDKSASEWNQNFLLHGAWPVGTLETDADLEPDDKKRLERQIKRVLSMGKDSSGRLLLLTGGLKYNALAIKPKDTDWVNARQMSRDEILAIFGVPFAIAGLFSTEQTTARSAGVEQQIKQFYRTTIFPKVEIIVSAINRHLSPLFRQTAEFVADYRSVPALQEEVDQEKTRAEALKFLVDSGLSLNKGLLRLYPDITPEPWGNVSWKNQNLMPVKNANMPDIPKPASPGGAIPSGGKPPAIPAKPPTKAEQLQQLGAMVRIMERVRLLQKR